MASTLAIRLLCAGSRLYSLCELVCGDDTEQLVAQAWVVRDGLAEPSGSVRADHGPDGLWVVAAGGGLFEAGGEVVLVVVGLGEQAGGVLGAEIDLEEPVVLVAVWCGGDGFEVRSEPAARAVGGGSRIASRPVRCGSGSGARCWLGRLRG